MNQEPRVKTGYAFIFILCLASFVLDLLYNFIIFFVCTPSLVFNKQKSTPAVNLPPSNGP